MRFHAAMTQSYRAESADPSAAGHDCQSSYGTARLRTWSNGGAHLIHRPYVRLAADHIALRIDKELPIEDTERRSMLTPASTN
jgi:hypothetical protein